MSKPLLSIIIPCFNAERFIGGCLDSILRSESQNYEVIIVDDGSKDKSREILKNYEHLPQIRILYLDQNQGPAKARNLGVKNSSGRYIFFLDMDTKIAGDCLKAVVDGFKNNQNLGALQTKLLQGETTKIDAAGHFISIFGFPYEIGVGEEEKEHSKKTVIFGARSAGMAIKRDVFEKVGGFDEDYLIYGEETDLSWRVWLAGNEIQYFPKAKVRHFQKSTLNEKTKHRIFYEGAKNNTRNILKNAAPNVLFWMLPLHILGWLFVSLKLILQKRFGSAVWIYRGLWWNSNHLRQTAKKRKFVKIFSRKDNQCGEMLFGDLNMQELILKGWRWLRSV